MRDHCKSAPKSFMRRSATRWVFDASFPGVETPGYHRISLRENPLWDLSPRPARNSIAICRGAAFDGSPAFQGRV
jgi:hypothetical protein